MTETAVLPQTTGAKVIAEVIRKTLSDAVIYSVPGSPITDVITNLSVQNFVDYEEADMVRRLTGINSHGITTVAVMKHSGFLAVQELMATLANHDLRAPFILIVGDEPGATSQTGNDTRYLCDSCHLPLVELSLSNISESLNFCIEVSSKLRKPVVLRVVSSLVQQQCRLLGKDSRSAKKVSYISRDSDYFASEGFTLNRSYHLKILKEEIASSQYSEELNKLHTKRGGRDLVIAAGNIFDRVINVVVNHDVTFDLLEINTVNLLPELRIAKTLNQYTRVLVLESWDVYLEEKIRSLVQRYELTVSILGRQRVCGVPFINAVGELSDEDLVRIIKTFDSESQFLENKNFTKPRSYPFLKAKDIEKYLEIYKAFQTAASEMELEPCLSVSTGQTRYSIPGTEFEGMVKFMGAMGSETQELLGYLDFLPFEKR